MEMKIFAFVILHKVEENFHQKTRKHTQRNLARSCCCCTLQLSNTLMHFICLSTLLTLLPPLPSLTLSFCIHNLQKTKQVQRVMCE